MKGATITHCPCPEPKEPLNPRGKGSCIKCGRLLNPEWVDSEKNVAKLFDRLAEALPPGEADSEAWWAFRAHCESRERMGRSTFGFRYLNRSNTSEALEEAADYCLYLLLDSLREIRDNGSEEDMDLVLIGARHAFKCHETARHLRARRHGAP